MDTVLASFDDPAVTLLQHHDGPMGYTIHDQATVSLRADLTWAEARCTLTHELLHVERGPTLDDPVLIEREELQVEKATARRLLPCIRAIADVLAWAHHLDEAAAELDVDPRTLWIRLRYLHPAELGWLRSRQVSATF